jgi:hypothetical protein
MEIMDKNKIYLELMSKFNQTNNLYHYTSFDVLKIIINTKKFRLTRIDEIGDKLEVKYIDRIWKYRTFIGCFTDSYNNEIVWKNFARNSSGICIDFGCIVVQKLRFYDARNYEFEKIIETDFEYTSYDNPCDFGIRSVSGLKVIYEFNPELLAEPNQELIDFFEGVKDVNDRDDFHNHPFQGFIKEARLFDNEKEFRIRVALIPKGKGTSLTTNGQIFHSPSIKYIFMGVDINQLKIYIKRENPYVEEINDLCHQHAIKVIVIDN